MRIWEERNLIFLLVVLVLGFELRALCLVGSFVPLELFALVIFQVASHIFLP
jgi:hypothetical protein